MQGIALIQSEKVNLFEPRQLAVGATILITGHRRQPGAEGRHLPVPDSRHLPERHPGDLFACAGRYSAESGLLILPPSKFGVEEREKRQLRIVASKSELAKAQSRSAFALRFPASLRETCHEVKMITAHPGLPEFDYIKPAC
ncbi:MAG: hypothetical protein U0559_01400 [Anaerolineae bacterium]